MTDGLFRILSQRTAEPLHPFPSNYPIRVQSGMQIGDTGDVTSDHDDCSGLVAAHQLAHMLHFQNIHCNAADSDYFVMAIPDFFYEAVQCREIKQRTWGGHICLDKHEAPGAMEHPQRERSLNSGHLVVIELHGIDPSAAELVILGIGTEYACQKNPSFCA